MNVYVSGDFYRRTVVCRKWVTPFGDLDLSPQCTTSVSIKPQACSRINQSLVIQCNLLFLLVFHISVWYRSFTTMYVMGQSWLVWPLLHDTVGTAAVQQGVSSLPEPSGDYWLNSVITAATRSYWPPKMTLDGFSRFRLSPCTWKNF